MDNKKSKLALGMAALALAGMLTTSFEAHAIPFAKGLTEGTTGHIHGYQGAEDFIKQLHKDYPAFAAEVEKLRASGQDLDDTDEFNMRLDKRLRLISAVTSIGGQKEYAQIAIKTLTGMYQISYDHVKSGQDATDPSFNRNYIVNAIFELARGGRYGAPNKPLIQPAVDFFITVIYKDPDVRVRWGALNSWGGLTNVDEKLVPDFIDTLENLKSDRRMSPAVDQWQDLISKRKSETQTPSP